MAEFAAPTGFASLVGADLLERVRAYGTAHSARWPAWTGPRIDLLNELAVTISGRGNRDPLVAALAVSGKWEPGRRVEALIDSVLVIPQPSTQVLAAEDNKRCEEATAKLPNADSLLHQLCVAIVRDCVEEARRIRDRAASELLAIQPDARIESLETRAVKAELSASKMAAEAARAKKSEEVLLREAGLLRAELRWHAEQTGIDPEAYIASVTAEKVGETPAEDQPEEESRDLPKGIRQRGDRFEALVYRSETADSRQRSAGTYDTLEEAVAAREAALERELESLRDEEPAVV